MRIILTLETIAVKQNGIKPCFYVNKEICEPLTVSILKIMKFRRNVHLPISIKLSEFQNEIPMVLVTG